jgi:hypothetical protein
MIEGNIDDRGVHDLDESWEHDCQGDNPFIHFAEKTLIMTMSLADFILKIITYPKNTT